MKKTVTLKDGSEVVIRGMQENDLDRCCAFFSALPGEHRVFLRTDVTRRQAVEQRIACMRTGRVRRIVALAGDAIVADGVLELAGHGWEDHVGEIRLIVAQSHQRKGLGLLMARELYGIAAEESLEEIVVKMMRPQIAARSIFRKLGFRKEVVLPDFVKDRSGRRQDLVLMRCNLDRLWQEYEDELARSDWQRTR